MTTEIKGNASIHLVDSYQCRSVLLPAKDGGKLKTIDIIFLCETIDSKDVESPRYRIPLENAQEFLRSLAETIAVADGKYPSSHNPQSRH